MPIKSSVLIRTLSDHAIGSIREQLAADVERLEAYGEKIDGFISSNNRDEPPKECERKPLKYYQDEGLFVVVRDSDNTGMTVLRTEKEAFEVSKRYNFPCSIVRVMEPTGNECPTERIVPEGCEWGIMRTYTNHIEWCSRAHQFYASSHILTDSLRFPSQNAAGDYIAANGIANCQPWPIPPKGGAE